MIAVTGPRARAALATAGTGLLVVAALVMVVAVALGYRVVPVLTGSMTPYAPAGSLAFTAPVPGDDVEPGDVVAFRPPRPFVVAGDRPVLHRVTAVGHTAGHTWMTTRGDANPAADPWRVALSGADLGRAVFVVPHLGRIFAAGPIGALAVLAGLAVVGAGLRRLHALDTVTVETIPLHARGHRAW